MKTENWDAETYDAARRRLVPCYDAFYGTVVELVTRLAPTQPRVLDLGAGTGLLSAELAAVVPIGSLTLMDASAPMLERAQRRLAALNPEVVCADFGDPLPAGPFDAIISALAIHHLDDDRKQDLYGRSFDRLAPGGVFVNAEQVSHADPVAQKLFESTHLEKARKRGSDETEIAAALERMRADCCSPTDQQVRWLAESGYQAVGVYYQWFRFAVLAGCKPKSPSR